LIKHLRTAIGHRPAGGLGQTVGACAHDNRSRLYATALKAVLNMFLQNRAIENASKAPSGGGRGPASTVRSRLSQPLKTRPWTHRYAQPVVLIILVSHWPRPPVNHLAVYSPGSRPGATSGGGVDPHVCIADLLFVCVSSKTFLTATLRPGAFWPAR
jgi:hypothetical protein